MRESTGNISFENEERCKKIKENFGNKYLPFKTVSKKDVLNLINERHRNKATVSNDIPMSIVRESISACYEIYFCLLCLLPMYSAQLFLTPRAAFLKISRYIYLNSRFTFLVKLIYQGIFIYTV